MIPEEGISLLWDVQRLCGSYKKLGRETKASESLTKGWFYKHCYVRIGHVYQITQFYNGQVAQLSCKEPHTLYKRCRTLINPKNDADLDFYDRWTELELQYGHQVPILKQREKRS